MWSGCPSSCKSSLALTVHGLTVRLAWTDKPVAVDGSPASLHHQAFQGCPADWGGNEAWEWSNQHTHQPLSSSPRALVGVLPIDLCVTTGYQLLLHVWPANKQLSHGASIAVSGDTPNVDVTPHYQPSQIISCLLCRSWVGTLASQLRSVDAGQPDLFSSRCTTGISVITIFDCNFSNFRFIWFSTESLTSYSIIIPIKIWMSWLKKFLSFWPITNIRTSLLLSLR